MYLPGLLVAQHVIRKWAFNPLRGARERTQEGHLFVEGNDRAAGGVQPYRRNFLGSHTRLLDGLPNSLAHAVPPINGVLFVSSFGSNKEQQQDGLQWAKMESGQFYEKTETNQQTSGRFFLWLLTAR